MQFLLYENTSPHGTVTREFMPSPLAFHQTLPGYAPTPLLDLPVVAEDLGVARVFLKDESNRLGLPAFKMLGASWAVSYAVRHAWLPSAAEALSPGELRALIEDPSEKRLVAATDGNHGRGVARMAAWLGVQCLIFVPKGLAESRIEAIQSEGAKVRVVDGSYDDAIRRSAEEADDNTIVVSDTSWDGYEDIPRQVTNGYSTMFAEIDDVLSAAGASPPTVLVLQAGVGSFAAAGLLHYRSGAVPGPRTVVVEPLRANCLALSAESGALTEAPPPHPSSMEGLNCGLPSKLTWPIIQAATDVFISIEDEAAHEAMRLLAKCGVVSGESGAAGLGGLLATARSGSPAQRAALGLTPDSVVLVINTESATDPTNYERVVGASPSTVQAQATARRIAARVTNLGTENQL